MAEVAQPQTLQTTATGATTPNPQQPEAQKLGTGFVNLQNYLSANQNNTLAPTVAGGVSSLVNNYGNTLQGQQGQFQQNVQNATYGQPQQAQASGLLNNILSGDASTLQSLQPTAAVGSTNTGATTGTAGSNTAIGTAPQTGTFTPAQQFQTYLQGQYTGPSNFASFNPQSSQLASQATQLSQLGANPQGLLQQFVGKNNPAYTGGLQNFDALLLGPNAAPVNQAISQAQALPYQYQNAATQANAQAQGAAQTNQLFGQNLTNQLNNAITGGGGTGTNAFAGTTALTNNFNNTQQAITNLQNAFTNNQLTPAALQAVGLTGQSPVIPTSATVTGGARGPEVLPQATGPYVGETVANSILNQPGGLSAYLTGPGQAGSAPLTIGNLMSGTQQAQLAALATLAGQSPGALLSGYTPTTTQINAANPLSFNATAFQNAVNNANTALNATALGNQDNLGNLATVGAINGEVGFPQATFGQEGLWSGETVQPFIENNFSPTGIQSLQGMNAGQIQAAQADVQTQLNTLLAQAGGINALSPALATGVNTAQQDLADLQNAYNSFIKANTGTINAAPATTAT